MKTNTFNVQINAPKERVWDVLWNDDTYRQWTAAFHEGSYAKSDWEEGGSIQFLSPEGDGMYSRIQKKIPNSVMIFEHLGEIKGGVEQPKSEWSGARESYYLSDNNGMTELKVEIDLSDEYAEYFKDIFPKALEVVKRLAEAKVGETI
jgi:uncharacterized protein YndB with AHSA1/START domain